MCSVWSAGGDEEQSMNRREGIPGCIDNDDRVRLESRTNEGTDDPLYLGGLQPTDAIDEMPLRLASLPIRIASRQRRLVDAGRGADLVSERRFERLPDVIDKGDGHGVLDDLGHVRDIIFAVALGEDEPLDASTVSSEAL